jgi:hypothetical protein
MRSERLLVEIGYLDRIGHPGEQIEHRGFAAFSGHWPPSFDVSSQLQANMPGRPSHVHVLRCREAAFSRANSPS